MILKYLDIQGFKSFPDKIRLSFTDGISAVVGPNGSGKSNISDAIRWVLGEQSTKNLRGSKMEDIVFFGTATRRPLGFAEVTLTVDNSDQRIAFDADEIAITRRFYRSGDSEYKINGATVRLKDIHEMLMDTGLGRDGYSIVSQGKITSIVDSRSDDRREIFEEAAGISKYRYRKNEAEKRLNQAEENLLRLRDILAELENQVGPLKEQSEKAKQFISFSKEKKELEIGLWLNTLESSKEELREQNHKLSLANVQYEEVEGQIADIQAQIDENFESANKCVAKIDEIRRESSEMEENAVRRESEAQLLQNNIFHNEESIKRIMSEIAESEKSADEMNAGILLRRTEIKKQEETIQSGKDKLVQLVEEIDRLQKGDSAFSGNIEVKSRKLTECSVKASDAHVRAVTADTQIAEIASRITVISKELEEAQLQNKSVFQELEETKAVLRLSEEKIESLTNAAEGYRLRVQKREEKSAELRKALDELNLDIQEKSRRAKMLEDMERNLEGFSYSVKAVMKQAEKNMLQGIHGPVSRIISASKEYSTAIETALGGAMQNIVVGTEDDAKRAISYLKKNDGGRATFLPISSIKGNRLKQDDIGNNFGFVGIAAELVEFKPEYEGIVDSLLGRTVVAEDIDCAVGIARKYGYKFRVVTLDGQVVNAGGSLTGGSAVRSAHLISRRNEIEACRQEAQKLTEKRERTRNLFRSAEEEAAAARASLSGTQGELTSSQEDKIRFEGEYKRLQERLQLLQKSIDESSNESKLLDGRIIELKAQKIRMEEEASNQAEKIAQIESELGVLTGNRQQLIEQRTKLTEVMQEQKLSIISSEKEIESLERSIFEIQTRISSQSGRIEEFQREIQSLKEKNNRTSQEAEHLTAMAQELRESAKKAVKDIEQLNQQRMEIEKTSADFRKIERDKNIERDVLGRELARLEEQKISIHDKYDDIIKKLWDEYELTHSQAKEEADPVQEPQKAQRKLAEIKNNIKLLGSVNVSAIEQYAEVSERYELMHTQVNDVEQSKTELLKMIYDFTQNMRDIFNQRFAEINNNFGETFKELFGGGSAYFQLTDPEDVLNSGIEIHAQPPGKNITHLESLSGGEKSLIAIAIYFAIMKVNPTPFCVLDEIEAALDDVNVDRYASYLRRMSENTQFIVITHRRGTMEEADVIYGVTMQNEGVSKLLELNLEEAEAKLGM